MIRPFLIVLASALAVPACTDSDFASSGKVGSKSPEKDAKDEGDSDGSDAPDSGDNPDGGDAPDSDGLDDGDASDSGGIDSDDGNSDEGGTDTDSNSATKDGGEIGEEGEIAKIPGVQVERVGVNFEDNRNPDSDHDHNDAVLCFTGKFKVQDSNVISIAKQTVSGTTSSISGCKHKIKVEITHKDGTKEPPINYDSRAPAPVSMTFKVGSKLEVYMTPYEPAECDPGVERNMHDAADALVKPDVCNTTGE